MPAGLSYSITSLLPLLPMDVGFARQEELLHTIARMCPGVGFYDVLHAPEGAVVCAVHVSGSGITRLAIGDAPAHVGKGIMSAARELMGEFEDHGDVLIAGWNDESHAREIVIGEHPRTPVALEDFAQIVEDALSDAIVMPTEHDAETVAFYRTLTAAIAVALRERLPIVAHW